MAAAEPGWWVTPLGWPDAVVNWRNRLVGSHRFQLWASRLPLVRRLARRDGERLFDLMAGFVYAQILQACVELGVLRAAHAGPLRPEAMAGTGVPPERMAALFQAAAALGLLDRRRDGKYLLGRLGAAVLGVPGLEAMIRHHRVFYRDLVDPAALLRGQAQTELARFWPYVGDAGGAVGREAAAAYSELMAVSQALVADETLRGGRLDGVAHLMDVGGGTGTFLAAVGEAYPDARLTLFDLPAVTEAARKALAARGMAGRVSLTPGSFRADALPLGADAISLVRVLYDHDDATVAALLARVHAALPPGGRVIVSEPMSGGARPNRFGDGYFAFYTMAMGTGRTRSPERIAALLAEAGFVDPRIPRMARPFITQVVTARNPA